MVLTVFAVEKAKPRERPFMLTDGNGLHLLVGSNGSKLWRFRYRFGGRQKFLSLGSFPEATLAEARLKRDDARRLIAQGTDPSAHRNNEKTAAQVAGQNTFGAVVTDYLAKLK